MRRNIKIIATIAVLVLLVSGCFMKSGAYTIGSSVSEDGRYEIVFESTGDPVWPYGPSPAALSLLENGKVLCKTELDVSNDGGTLAGENWKHMWLDDCVLAIVSGEEQNDVLYTLRFDGTFEVSELGGRHFEFDDIIRPSDGEEKKKPPDYSSLAMENPDGETVFGISSEAFIESYNRIYSERNGEDYLTAIGPENWDSCDSLSLRFGYPSTRQRFTEDKSVHTNPTVSVYESAEGEIYEVRMTFDDHGFREALYEKFGEMCRCLFLTACPEMAESEAESLFLDLYSSAGDDFFGDRLNYGDPERPVLTLVRLYGNVGFYSFYGAGNIEICMIPMTGKATGRLVSEGTNVASAEPLKQ